MAAEQGPLSNEELQRREAQQAAEEERRAIDAYLAAEDELARDDVLRGWADEHPPYSDLELDRARDRRREAQMDRDTEDYLAVRRRSAGE